MAFSSRPVIYIAGNHEFYKQDWNRTLMRLRAAPANSSFLLYGRGSTKTGLSLER